MKNLAVIILMSLVFTSCALKPKYYMEVEKKPMTTLEKIERCTYRLVEQNGIDSEKAQLTCNKIFRVQ